MLSYNCPNGGASLGYGPLPSLPKLDVFHMNKGPIQISDEWST